MLCSLPEKELVWKLPECWNCWIRSFFIIIFFLLFQIQSVLQQEWILSLQHVQPSLLWWKGKVDHLYFICLLSISVSNSLLCWQVSGAELQAFLTESEGQKVVMVADPPFGGLVTPLAKSFSLISQTWRKLQHSGEFFFFFFFSCYFFVVAPQEKSLFWSKET